MRLEKGYRHWKADLITEFNPFESGLARFVKMDKPDFPGKAALLTQHNKTPRRCFVSMTIDCHQAPAHAGESLMLDDQVIGTITSAGWGHRTGKNIAMAFVDPHHAGVGTRCDVAMLGTRFEATVCEPCLYNVDNQRLKA